MAIHWPSGLKATLRSGLADACQSSREPSASQTLNWILLQTAKVRSE
jgi:hypothetical protein